MRRSIRLCAVVLATCLIAVNSHADEVTFWNRVLFEAAKVANTTPVPMSRFSAIVHAAMYDAYNGIERRYTPIFVQPAAPAGASARVAVVQAAYVSLGKIYPTQQSTFDQKRTESLADISSGEASEHSQSIARGIAWGQKVADEIWTWRSGDGASAVLPPFTGNNNTGQWRSTTSPPSSMAGLQFADMTPWVINSPSQFLPAAPPALTSTQYATDFNEVKLMGNVSSPSRTADQTLYSLFWNAGTASYLWNTVALSLADERHNTLSENARLFGLLNTSMADAIIGCWNAKKLYNYWRPLTAIPLAATDGNTATTEDLNWAALFGTPNHSEYPSGHSCISGAAGELLSNYFGENSSFVVTSDVMVGVSRFFPSFTAATDEVKNARIFSGIHFRTACDIGQTLGVNVARFVLTNAFLRRNGR